MSKYAGDMAILQPHGSLFAVNGALYNALLTLRNPVAFQSHN
jgi:hypothetical protein